MKLNEWDLAKLMRLHLVVEHATRGLCRVEGFDLTQKVLTMPVKLRAIATEMAFEAPANEIVAVLVGVERGKEPPRGHQAFARRAA